MEIPPPPSPRRYWTRRGLAEWLATTFRAEPPTLVGIDHAFSFPRAYFQKYEIAGGWNGFLDDFCAHWPTDQDHVYVEFVRDKVCGNGAARQGSPRRLQETDLAGNLAQLFQPALTADERAVAEIEGWILGVR